MASSQQEPISNPTIPFTGSIQGGLEDGKSIIVTGRVLPGASRFSVNLRCGSESESNIALQFNPRYDDGPECIVTNTYTNSCWGQEEHIQQALLPRGGTFNLQILVTQSSYKISVNGNHIKDYNHRIPYNMVDTITINGMVEITSVLVQKTIVKIAEYRFQIPFMDSIQGGLEEGKSIIVTGRVLPGADRFSVNLRCGSESESNIALQFNPRYDDGPECIVTNTYTNSCWGQEERIQQALLPRGGTFNLEILVTQSSYKISVNGNHIKDYNHHIPYNMVDTISINGMVEITSVLVQKTIVKIAEYRCQIPFMDSIQVGLEDGKSIIVTGRVLPGADRFKVDLRCGSQSESDIALHFNPRYDDGPEYIVTNTYTNSCWGQEERIQQALLPRGGTFNLEILVTQSSYKISVNGNHIKDYNHRIPYNMVDTIAINGTVEITSVLVQKTIVKIAEYRCQIPFMDSIQVGLEDGKSIIVTGRVLPGADRFKVDLRCGSESESDIALHFIPRYDDGPECIVTNTYTNSCWGQEERIQQALLPRGSTFNLQILVTQSSYKISVNGNHIKDYNHRIPYNMVDTIAINGMVEITSVLVQKTIVKIAASVL